jgi:hypothetical protein
MATDAVSTAYAAMLDFKQEEEQRLLQHQHVVNKGYEFTMKR